MHATLLSMLAFGGSVVVAYPINASNVNCRSGPATTFGVVKQYQKGQQVTVSCQTHGESVQGDTVWDKTSDGCYVADYYVKTGTSNMVAGQCDSGGSGKSYPIKESDVNCRSGPGTSFGAVKKYQKGQKVELTCQTNGENIQGDTLWDKTKDGCYVADYYVQTGTSNMVTGPCAGSPPPPPPPGGGSGNLPGLDATQSAHARAIIAQTKKQGLGRQGCAAAITTGLTESQIRILANNKVPSSLKYKHDGTGSDYDSVGIFQQRAIYYTNIACDMDAACSASLFFKGMTAISGWKTMDVAKLCQKVQVSAYPDAYRKYTSKAASICAAGGS